MQAHRKARSKRFRRKEEEEEKKKKKKKKKRDHGKKKKKKTIMDVGLLGWCRRHMLNIIIKH